MKEGIKKEVKRKIMHICLGSISLLIIYLLKSRYGFRTLLNTGFGILLLTLFLEYLRIEKKKKIFWLSYFARDDEKEGLHHFTYTLLAVLLCLGIFEFKVAFAALCMSIFGDAAAAFVRFITPKKIIIWMVMTLISISISFALGMKIIGIPMAIIGGLIEIESYKISDNLTIPLFAGGIGHLLFALMK